MKAFLIKPDNTKTDLVPKNGLVFTLEELYGLIGTDTIEILYLQTGDIMIVDEDGKLRTNPEYNALATSYFQKDEIVGTVVMCSRKMFC